MKHANPIGKLITPIKSFDMQTRKSRVHQDTIGMCLDYYGDNKYSLFISGGIELYHEENFLILK